MKWLCTWFILSALVQPFICPRNYFQLMGIAFLKVTLNHFINVVNNRYQRNFSQQLLLVISCVSTAVIVAVGRLPAHYINAIMGATTSQIISLTIAYPTVKMQGIQRWPVNSPHKWPVTQKMFPVDDVIMVCGGQRWGKDGVQTLISRI